MILRQIQEEFIGRPLIGCIQASERRGFRILLKNVIIAEFETFCRH